MFIPEVASSVDTITPWKVSTHCVYTRGSVLTRITVRNARRPMLSDAAVLLQKGHVDAHGKDIHRGSSVKERKKDCFLGRKTASYTSITFNLQSEICLL